MESIRIDTKNTKQTIRNKICSVVGIPGKILSNRERVTTLLSTHTHTHTHAIHTFESIELNAIFIWKYSKTENICRELVYFSD